jgi:glutathione S-transferase
VTWTTKCQNSTPTAEIVLSSSRTPLIKCQIPPDGKNRSEVLAWTFWQVGGLGPTIGQWGHFSRSTPEKIPYAINRYLDESVRLLNVLNGHLTDRTFIADDYSIDVTI